MRKFSGFLLYIFILSLFLFAFFSFNFYQEKPMIAFSYGTKINYLENKEIVFPDFSVSFLEKKPLSFVGFSQAREYRFEVKTKDRTQTIAFRVLAEEIHPSMFIIGDKVSLLELISSPLVTVLGEGELIVWEHSRYYYNLMRTKYSPQEEMEINKRGNEARNKEYIWAQEAIKNLKIEKGVTTEGQVLEVIAGPLWVLNGSAPLDLKSPNNTLQDYLRKFAYSTPQSNQKIMGYRYSYITNYDGLRGGSGKYLLLFLTVNTISSLVENFGQFEESFML